MTPIEDGDPHRGTVLTTVPTLLSTVTGHNFTILPLVHLHPMNYIKGGSKYREDDMTTQRNRSGNHRTHNKSDHTMNLSLRSSTRSPPPQET
jgi:hypothetical protein